MKSSHEDQSSQTAHDGAEGGPMQFPGAVIPPNAPTEMLPWEAACLAPADGHPDEIESVDPFAQWSAAADRPSTSSPRPGTSGRGSPVRLAQGKPRSRREPAASRIGRRKFVTLLAAGTAGVITVVTVEGVSFARSPHHLRQLADDGSISTIPLKEQDKDKDGDGTGERDRDDDGEGQWPHKKPTPSGSPTKPTPSPTQTQTTPPPPTSTPTKTPTPTGTVIGSTTQPKNSAVSFTNPADSQGSFLIHLGNGNFVAGERACTHQGVPVNYDPTTGHLVCPAHGAIFDPANAFSVLLGPATRPLQAVSIHVNANGTVTTP